MCIRVSVSRVRTPLSPPYFKRKSELTFRLFLHVTQSERGEKPRQGSTKWLAAQRHFGRPTGRPQGELANQALSHRHIPRESLNSRSGFFLHVTQSERGEKPRQGSTKWLAAQRHFGRPTGRPQGELAKQARTHRYKTRKTELLAVSSYYSFPFSHNIDRVPH